MEFQRIQSLRIAGKELRLHLGADGQFVFETLLFLLFLEQTLQGFGHGVKRCLQGSQLIVGRDFDAVRQVTSIDILCGSIQLRDRSRNGPRESDADHERDQLDDPESDCHRGERDQNRGSDSAEICEDAVIQD